MVLNLVLNSVIIQKRGQKGEGRDKVIPTDHSCLLLSRDFAVKYTSGFYGNLFNNF